jgi:hypothetical protein
MKHAEIVGLMNREGEKRFPEMLVSIRDSLSDLASSNNGEDGEDDNDTGTEQGNLSEDDEPSWLMRMITKTVQQCMECFRQKMMQRDEFTPSGWEDTADNFHERDKKYGTCQWRVPVFVQLRTDDETAVLKPTPFGELMECLNFVPVISQMMQGTSQPGSRQVRIGSVKPQSNTSIPGHEPTVEAALSPLLKAKPGETVSIYPCIKPRANHDIDFGFRRKHSDSSSVCVGIHLETVIFDVKSW